MPAYHPMMVPSIASPSRLAAMARGTRSTVVSASPRSSARYTRRSVTAAGTFTSRLDALPADGSNL